MERQVKFGRLTKLFKWLDRHPYWVRAVCLAFWLGAPARSYFTGGPISLLGYLVVLGGYCLLRDSWSIVRGDL